MLVQTSHLGIAQLKQIQYQQTLTQDVLPEEPHSPNLMIGTAMEFQIGMT